MDSKRESVALFVGGLLHGKRSTWTDPPKRYPYTHVEGADFYSRCDWVHGCPGVDVVYAPAGMAHAVVMENLADLGAL